MTLKLNQSVWKTLVQYGAHPLSECSDGMLDRTIADCGFIEQPRLSDPALDKNSTAQVQRAVATDNDSVVVQDFTVQLALARPALLGTQAALAQALGPIGCQRGVGRAGYRVFIHAHPRAEPA